jgi:hypothetical protein
LNEGGGDEGFSLRRIFDRGEHISNLHSLEQGHNYTVTYVYMAGLGANTLVRLSPGNIWVYLPRHRHIRFTETEETLTNKGWFEIELVFWGYNLYCRVPVVELIRTNSTVGPD